ncbi:hypothetical protein FKW77_004362 [Venturia effusa]|uniref:Uncharacterized protein n=1 Tax=Venturia effusa TaxID=50376 RepID=A0A517L350_9PEZI|nr:hypothetical protein FKW77_004362 [Venturia effusa]
MSIWRTRIAPTARSDVDFQLFRYQYWNRYHVSHHVSHNAGQIHLVALQQTWNAREKSGVWLSVTCPVLVCSRAIVRRHHTRRFRAALAAEFNKQGLDRHGKVMAGQTPSFQGTLHVILNPSLKQSKGSAIRQACASMLSEIMERNQQSRSMNHSTDRQHSTKGFGDKTRTKALDQGKALNSRTRAVRHWRPLRGSDALPSKGPEDLNTD